MRQRRCKFCRNKEACSAVAWEGSPVRKQWPPASGRGRARWEVGTDSDGRGLCSQALWGGHRGWRAPCILSSSQTAPSPGLGAQAPQPSGLIGNMQSTCCTDSWRTYTQDPNKAPTLLKGGWVQAGCRALRAAAFVAQGLGAPEGLRGHPAPTLCDPGEAEAPGRNP